jgi:thiamine-monophosphate kinase
MSVYGQGELALLERIKPYLAAGATGDDAAVIADATGFVVASTDMFVEGVHFDLGWMTAEDVGWRSLALALGDLAAKGAEPAWVLSSLAIPKTWSVGALTGLYEGMHSLGQRYRLPIVGGDMSAIDGPAVLSLTVAGRTEKMPLARSQARPGWSVGVTGPLGAAAVALRERRAWRLDPRIAEGRRVNGLGLACGDVSDGLVRELEKFQAMANVGFILEAADVPLATGATIDEALTSGEEAELVCIGPEDVVRKSGLHVVGRSTVEQEVIVVGSELETTGYDHFA